MVTNNRLYPIHGTKGMSQRNRKMLQDEVCIHQLMGKYQLPSERFNYFIIVEFYVSGRIKNVGWEIKAFSPSLDYKWKLKVLSRKS